MLKAANRSVESVVPKLHFGFPPPTAPAAPHVKSQPYQREDEDE
jgi:hypothetical protein